MHRNMPTHLGSLTLRTAAALGFLTVLSLSSSAGIAGAAPAPKLTTTVPPGGTATSPAVAPLGEFLGTLCGFSPLSPVNFSVVAVSGAAADEGSQIANQQGCVTFDGRVVGHLLSVNGSAPAKVGYGINDVIGTGNNPANEHVYDTLRVPIDKSGSRGLISGSPTRVANITSWVVGSFFGLALVYLVFMFIRHRVSGIMRVRKQTT
jgi:hypothetical protein